MITFGEAKKILAQYAGRGGLCATNDQVDLFVRQVLEYILISGEYGNIRTFTFNAYKGCFTVPYELEVPLKILIDDQVGSSWDRWFNYHATKELGVGCIPADKAIVEDPNYYPTVYDLPVGGSQVGVLGRCEEAEDAHVLIQGVDVTGKEVYTVHKGVKQTGEYLSIKKGQIKYSETKFLRVDHVIKTRTNGYVQLLWVNPTYERTGFLADYSPVEEKPSYRRYRLSSNNCGQYMKVSVLARIRLKSAYTDNDFIPFDTLYTLHLAAQAINANLNDSPDLAKAKDSTMQDMISRGNEYKRVNNGQPIEVYLGTSPGRIQNII